MTGAMKLEQLAQAVAAAGPDLDSDGRQVAVGTYRLLALGRPVSPARVAEAAAVPLHIVEENLRSWPLVFWDDEGRVVGFWGLTTQRMEPAHAMTVDGRTVYGWCAWDTLFITEVLGTGTEVESTDPHDGTTIHLTVTPAGVSSVRPAGAVVSLLLPDGAFGPDTIGSFCHRIHLFASPRSAEQWMADRPEMFSLTVEDAFRLGQLTNRLRLGDAIGDNLPDRTPA